MKQEITSKERVMLSLEHKQTDRVPFGLGFGANEPVRVKLAERLHMKDADEVEQWMLGYSDLRRINPLEICYRGPADRELHTPDGRYIDNWGIIRTTKSYGEGSYEEISTYPLANVTDISQLDGYLWPSADWYDETILPDLLRQLVADGDKAIILTNGTNFETSWYMRGFEKFFSDLALEPELAWEIMRRVTDFNIAYYSKMLNAAQGKVDIAFMGDDLGHQKGLLMSLPMWEEMLKPHHVRFIKALLEFGVKVMYHTDGAVMKAVPGLIDMGIDVLEALQFDAAGMDPVRLKQDYGDRLCFHGGVSVQSTLPFGTPAQVREEVRERIRVLGANGGYILAPSHAIQAGTPPENVIAFLEAAREDLPKVATE